jgi:hypothetical protein
MVGADIVVLNPAQAAVPLQSLGSLVTPTSSHCGFGGESPGIFMTAGDRCALFQSWRA